MPGTITGAFFLTWTGSCRSTTAVFPALLNDLDDRGLLDTTLVISAGEFGRTPKINAHKRGPGRDHWGRCFTLTMGGGGIRTGQVIGASDKYGALPEERPVSVADFVATVYHALGPRSRRQVCNPGTRDGNAAGRLGCQRTVLDPAATSTPLLARTGRLIGLVDPPGRERRDPIG